MTHLLRYLVLPSEISAFERGYLRRMNRIALVFFYCHWPVFIGVAALSGARVAQAAVLTPLVLIGPTLAYRWFRNPRLLSAVYGATAMVMGGLLVHLGQGPMQIEMHFYFFVLIALLAVFANPLAVLSAAVTVAIHHFAVWLLMPASVFNYQASFWTVVVHAAFVVIESVAAVFVARSFFDNVIGLEKIVAARTTELDARTRDMRLVLDNVGQGFVTVQLDGTMSRERSRVVETWLGPAPASGNLFEYLATADREAAGWMAMGWAELASGIMPTELTLEQLPRRIIAGGRHLSFAYQALGAGDVPDLVMVVISDVTAEVARELSERERRELIAAFERFASDRNGFMEFCAEAAELVRVLERDDAPLAEQQRQLHTLKGNAALFGVESIAACCHAIESRVIEDATPPTAEERAGLTRAWRDFTARIETLLGSRNARQLEISPDDLEQVLAALRRAQPAAQIERMVAAWRLEPVSRRFERVAEQAQRLAKRLGKDVVIDIADHGLRLDPERWAKFWAAFVHAVRNAVDHGVESASERTVRGKAPAARIELRAIVEDRAMVLEIRDDGRGVDWDRVRERARAQGLAHDTHEHLVGALFADGMSTRDEVTETSGRGVGMSALREATHASGGAIALASQPQLGTTVRFSFPLDRLSEIERPVYAAEVDAQPSGGRRHPAVTAS